MEYISITKISEKWGSSTRRIRILCNEGRIPVLIKRMRIRKYQKM